MADKTAFINDYFFRIFERNIHILDNDSDMKKKMKVKFDE